MNYDIESCLKCLPMSFPDPNEFGVPEPKRKSQVEIKQRAGNLRITIPKFHIIKVIGLDLSQGEIGMCI